MNLHTLNTKAVSVKGMDFSFSKRAIFTDFSFDSEKTISILRGPSGCGKTTFLKILAGVLRPAEVDVFKVPQHPALVLQDDSLAPWLSGFQNITLFTGASSELVQKHPLYRLVEPFVHQKALEMSYGQRRLIELLRVFLIENAFLLLDEPLNFLDRDRRAQFIEFLRYNCSDDTRIILTSHLAEEFGLPQADHYEFSGEAPHSSLLRLENCL